MKKKIVIDNLIEDTNFQDFFNDLTDCGKYSQPRDVYLRPSMLPVCSVTLLMNMIACKEGLQSLDDYFSLYFTSVGTTVHETTQSLHAYASNKNYKVWGNWKCPSCGEEWMYSTRNMCKCGERAGYEEIQLEAYGFKGHIDCILITDKGVLVCDYKTTTAFNTTKHFSGLNVAYSLQILAYCLMLEKVWGEHFKELGYGSIYGGSLLFICRDNPSKTNPVTIAFNKKTRKEIKSLLALANTQIESARKSLKTGNLSHIMSCKSCKDRKQYINEIAPFHKYSPCFMAEDCWSKSLIKDYIKYDLESTIKFK